MGATSGTTQTRRLELSRETIAFLTEEMVVPVRDALSTGQGQGCVTRAACSAECPSEPCETSGCTMILTICIGGD